MKKIFLILFLLTSLNYAQNILLFGEEIYKPINFELTRYNNSLSSKLPNTQLERIDSLISMLKDTLSVDSLPQAFDVFYIFANSTQEASLKNLSKRDFDATIIGTIPFTQYEGLEGLGVVGYVSLDYIPLTDAVVATQNSTSIGIYSRTDLVTQQNADFGGYPASGGRTTTTLKVATGGYFQSRVNSSTFGTYSVANSTTLGLHIASRISATNVIYYRGQTATENITNNSTGLPGVSYFLFAYNNNGSPAYATLSTTSNRQYSILFIGKSLNATEVRGVNNIIEWYMDDLGKGVQ